MNAEREVLYTSLLATQVENPDLGIGYTSTEARLGVRFVLAVPIAVSSKRNIKIYFRNICNGRALTNEPDGDPS